MLQKQQQIIKTHEGYMTASGETQKKANSMTVVVLIYTKPETRIGFYNMKNV